MNINEQKLHSFLFQTIGDLASGYAGVMISLGHKAGLYKAMAGEGRMTSAQIAERAGCAERYVREWLNNQAAGGYVVYNSEDKTYELPDEHALVLAHEDGPAFIPAAWEVPASMWFDEDKAVKAFQTGDGIPWSNHHGRLYCGVAAFFRNSYKSNLVQNWIPALDGVKDRLKQGINVADVGCGHGHSTIIMAKAYPNSRFWGFDYHKGSVDAARELAVKEGVADRVTFEVAKAKEFPGTGYNLICYFDCLHDMGDPVGAAAHARQALDKNGTVMLIEPFANDNVEDNMNPVGRLYYAASATLCCAHSLSEEVGLALGAQAGEERLADVFRNAGFSSFRRATETPFNLILEARP